MSFFKRFSGRNDRGNVPPEMPWDRRPSILEFVRAHIDSKQPGLSDDGYELPDEERFGEDSEIRWAPGAMDGVMTHHMGQEANDDIVRKMLDLVLEYSRQPTARNKLAVYQYILKEHVVSVIDPVMSAVAGDPNLDQQRLYELAYSFVTESPDREPVKFGIAILGLYRVPENQELFQVLGRHDEFTLYCAVAITNAADDPEDALWTLAKNTTGWGRIHIVERLAQTTNPALKNWLLREGYRNAVMYEYLAATCARAGDLPSALSEPQVDRELLTSAGEILQALMTAGPAESIDDYEHACPVIQSYLGHVASRAETIKDFLHVHSVKGYLDGEDSQWEQRYDAGWTTESRNAMRLLCNMILGRPEWADRIRAELTSDNELHFFQANEAASLIGIDTWDIHWRRLQEMPSDSGRWYQVMTRCNEERIGKVIDFAESSIDLASIATGAALENGFGPSFELHNSLDYVLQELGKFPGRGARLIAAGLKSPSLRNRNMAANALAGWTIQKWPAGIKESLEQAVECEPDDDVRDRMQKTLRGEPLDDE